jgi:1-acyl-sn-glycerol-3-phosphate acyltransferase
MTAVPLTPRSLSIPADGANETYELSSDDLHVEPLVPFDWRVTLYSALAWPLPAISILAGYAVVRLLDKTVLPGPKMFRLPKFCAWLTMLLGGVRVRARGHERLDPKSTYVFVPNHVSMFDAPVLSVASPQNARAFQERRHLKIPIYGGLVKVFGEVLVDVDDNERKNSRTKLQNSRAYAEALARLRAGMSWLVFPEGQRSPDGRLGPFYPGAFRLAIEAGVPVVPVAQRGLRNICPPGEWRVRPGVVEVVFGEPIPTVGLTTSEQDIQYLARRARYEVNRLLKG